MGGIESCLFDFSEVISCVLVKLEDTDFAERELLLWPDVGQVEDVDLLLLPQIFSFLGRHSLPGDGPGGVVLLLDGFE